MIVARSARRSGITLTEILISILIMGVGLISLATLFPLGLVRLRLASQFGRSAMTLESASDDTNARALLYKPSFRNTWYGLRDPFVQDTDASGNYVTGNPPVGTGALASGNLLLPHNNLSYDVAGDGYTGIGNLTSGLPFCYDPLWRSLTGVMPGVGLYDPTLIVPSGYAATANEARFGSGIFGGATPYIALDADKGIASACGLQRLTNFIPWNGDTTTNLNSQYSFTCTNQFLTTAQPPDVAGNLFTSVDDIVYNPLATSAGAPSSLIPDLSSGGPQADYRYSWFFTGRQTDAGGNGAQFTGEIVVCDSRPFGFDPLPSGTGSAPTGETVVEAIYGYGGNTRAVLLRWKNTLADPTIRVGGWICDTTYERSVATYRSRLGTTPTGFIPPPYARCYWYQVAKRIDPTTDSTDNTYRSAVITLVAPVRVITPITSTGFGSPAHVNVALIMPSVVNVFNRAFEVH